MNPIVSSYFASLFVDKSKEIKNKEVKKKDLKVEPTNNTSTTGDKKQNNSEEHKIDIEV